MGITNKILINPGFYDVLETGIKVIRVDFDEDYTKIDLGFLYSEKRKNTLKITNDIFLSDYKEKKTLIECTGINLDEEITLKSVKDFRYFSLKFEPFDEAKKELMLIQGGAGKFNISIISIGNK